MYWKDGSAGRCILLPPILQVGPGDAAGEISSRLPKANHALWILEWQGTQKHSVDHAKDRRVRSNAERQGSNCDGCKSLVLEQASDYKSKVGFHMHGPPQFGAENAPDARIQSGATGPMRRLAGGFGSLDVDRGKSSDDFLWVPVKTDNERRTQLL